MLSTVSIVMISFHNIVKARFYYHNLYQSTAINYAGSLYFQMNKRILYTEMGDSSRKKIRKGRHPSHLRGKEIGLFYAKKSKARKQEEEDNPKPLGMVYLSEARVHHIQGLLKNNPLRDNFFVVDGSSYEHVENSAFKTSFLKIISGDIASKLIVQSSKLKADEELNQRMYNEMQIKLESTAYKYMQNIREKLPSFKMREQIIKLMKENQVIVVSGETGCGKTTQVAQFILDDYINNKNGSICKILCTQPRRISAIAVAERVAEERAENIGYSSGYHIRLEKKLPRDRGSICFCTTGVVLKIMESDPSLGRVSHIILDEIHERDIMSDFLITLLKQVTAMRKDLKVILMSATLNSEQFSKYYDNCPIINIPGYTFPVQEFYLEDVLERTKFSFLSFPNSKRFRPPKGSQAHLDFIEPHLRHLEKEKQYSRHVIEQLKHPKSEEINLELILALLVNICQKEEDGAILVFLTGYGEISKLNQLMETSNKFPKSRYLIIPLHSLMPTINQKQMFNRPPKGVRKIIIATNIAETSITIDDVVFVIDCGRIKMSNFNSETNTQTLLPEWVSLANAKQRKGRAGRVQSGYCFHLFTKARKMLLEQYQKPEILRIRLETVILTIKILQLGKVEPFLSRMLDSPDPSTITLSLNLLKHLNALGENETLTPLGYHLARLPVHPQIGKMILLGAIFSCLDPVLCIAASLDFKDAFQSPMGKEKEVDIKKMELSKGWKSDHLVLYEALNQFYETNCSRKFCHEYFLHWQTLCLLTDMKKQFMQYLYELNFVPNTDPHCLECNKNSSNLSLVKAIVSAGLYPNVIIAKQKKHRATLKLLTGETVKLHPKSVLSKVTYFESPLLVYFLRIRSSSNYVHDATMVHPLSLIFFGETCDSSQGEDGMNVIRITNKLTFKCKEETALLIKELRDRMNWFLEYKISHPGVVDWIVQNNETKLLRAIIELITSEDIGIIDLDVIDHDVDDDE